jgi:hypothetical protein
MPSTTWLVVLLRSSTTKSTTSLAQLLMIFLSPQPSQLIPHFPTPPVLPSLQASTSIMLHHPPPLTLDHTQGTQISNYLWTTLWNFPPLKASSDRMLVLEATKILQHLADLWPKNTNDLTLSRHATSMHWHHTVTLVKTLSIIASSVHGSTTHIPAPNLSNIPPKTLALNITCYIVKQPDWLL